MPKKPIMVPQGFHKQIQLWSRRIRTFAKASLALRSDGDLERHFLCYTFESLEDAGVVIW